MAATRHHGKLDASAAQGETATPQRNPQQLDASYNALKTYLMLHEQKRMDEAHLIDQLPRYWRPYLESQRGQYSVEEVMAVAEKLVAFYVSQIKEADLPLIDNNAKVVGEARDVLRGSFKRLSAQERVFNEIKARANTRFSPLTVARILDNRDLDVIAGARWWRALSPAKPGTATSRARSTKPARARSAVTIGCWPRPPRTILAATATWRKTVPRWKPCIAPSTRRPGRNS